MHQKIVDVPILILAIFHDSKHRNRKTEPRGRKTESNNQKQIHDHSNRTQIIGFVFVTMFDVEEFPKH